MTAGAGAWAVAAARFGPLFVFALIAALVSYGIDLFNCSLSLDEELQSVASGAEQVWIHQDRWGMYLLNAIVLPMPSLPFLSGLIGIGALAAAAVLVVDLWAGGGPLVSDREAGPHAADGTADARSCLAAGLLVSTPVHSFLVHFNTTQYGVFLGLLVGVVSVRMFVRGGVGRRIVGWLLLVFAFSVYQSIGLAVMVIYLFSAINGLLRLRFEPAAAHTLGVRAAWFGCWWVAAAAAHKLTAVITRGLTPEHEGYAIIDLAYSGGLWKRYRVDAVAEYLLAYLGGGKWYLGMLSVVVLWAGVVLVLVRFANGRRPGGVVVGAALLVAAMLTPFLIVIGTGVGWWPTRTLLGVPVLLAGVAFTAGGAGFAPARLAYVGATALCLWHFAVSNNRLMYADQQQWVLDRQRMMEIARRVELAAGPEAGRTQLAVLGVPRSDPSPGRFQEETIGMSYFSPELTMMESGSTSIRVGIALGVLGREFVGISTPAEYRAAIAIASEMPHWPIEGSVVVRDGLAVVKLGPPTEAQTRYAARHTPP